MGHGPGITDLGGNELEDGIPRFRNFAPVYMFVEQVGEGVRRGSLSERDYTVV